MGRPPDAGADADPRALRAGEAARRHPPRGLPARHHGDREPRSHPDGGRRRCRALRVEPALDPGRDRRGARRPLRSRGPRHQRRGQRHLLPPHPHRRRQAPPHHDGRRRRCDLGPARRAPRAALGDLRRHRGDDDRRDPPQGARGRGQARLPDHRRQRGEHQALLRQPLRDRAVDPRRRDPRHQRPDRRPQGGRHRLRLVRQGRRDAGQGPRRPRDRLRGRPAARARGGPWTAST